jgi:hypothetical protein
MSPRDVRSPRRETLRLGVALAAVALVAIVVWLVAIRDGDAETGPEAMSTQKLADFAGDEDHTVYWAGEGPGSVYEVTRTKQGNVFVRYLDSEDQIGDDEADFLTIGTYPMDDAYDVTTAASNADDAISGRSPDGGLVVANESAPTSVYLAYPGGDVQIEIYDPDPERAMKVATSGDVEPIP